MERIMVLNPRRDVIPCACIPNVRLLPTRLLFVLTGLSGEVGEFADALLKWIYYGQELDQTNLKEELGDLLWYITKACSHLDLTLEEVMQGNVDKLRVRYPKAYSDHCAAEENRNRDQEREVLE
jgi:NTP pyrophosphatase (non-canonical NTP hydrolase)